MSKRQEIRERRRRERMRNQILVVLFIVAGALLITFALVMPTVQGLIDRANATEIPVTPIATRTFSAPVDGTSLGDPNAPVRVEVWEDFQCPACKTYTEGTEAQLIATYVETGVVYYTFYQYPFIDGTLSERTIAWNDGESDHAANASLCAAEQDRFWDYHDMLFANWNGENQNAFADERLLRFAEVLELDMDSFTQCFEDDRYRDRIEEEYTLGQQWGNTGTPSVYVNGVLVSPGYVPSFEQVAAAIEAALNGE